MLIASDLKHLELWEFDQRKQWIISIQLICHMYHLSVKQARYRAQKIGVNIIQIVFVQKDEIQPIKTKKKISKKRLGSGF